MDYTARQASLSSPTPGASSNSCPLSRWCHSTISSSVVPFSSSLQSFPASESLPVSQLFKLSGQSIGASASASVLPMNIQDWFPIGLTDWISEDSSATPQFKSINSLVLSLPYCPTRHIHTFLTGKTVASAYLTPPNCDVSLIYCIIELIRSICLS